MNYQFLSHRRCVTMSTNLFLIFAALCRVGAVLRHKIWGVLGSHLLANQNQCHRQSIRPNREILATLSKVKKLHGCFYICASHFALSTGLFGDPGMKDNPTPTLGHCVRSSWVFVDCMCPCSWPEESHLKCWWSVLLPKGNLDCALLCWLKILMFCNFPDSLFQATKYDCRCTDRLCLTLDVKGSTWKAEGI